jgi:hypothetical protein
MILNPEQVNRAVNILNDQSIRVTLFGKDIHVEPPTCGTIEEACRYLALLPKGKITGTEDNMLAKLVDISPQIRPMYYAAAVLIYGERKCYRKRFYCFGRENIEHYAERMRKECAPAEIRNALLTMLGSQICSDFFGLVSAIMEVLIVETK